MKRRRQVQKVGWFPELFLQPVKEHVLDQRISSREMHDQTQSDLCIRKIPVDSKLRQKIQVETCCKVKGRRRQTSTSSERFKIVMN